MLPTTVLKYSTESGAGPVGRAAGGGGGGGGVVAAPVVSFFGVEHAASITATATAVRIRCFIILPLSSWSFFGRARLSLKSDPRPVVPLLPAKLQEAIASRGANTVTPIKNNGFWTWVAM